MNTVKIALFIKVAALQYLELFLQMECFQKQWVVEAVDSLKTADEDLPLYYVACVAFGRSPEQSSLDAPERRDYWVYLGEGGFQAQRFDGR